MEAALRGYYSILNGESSAKYLISKGRCIDVSLGGDAEYLWNAHQVGLGTRLSSGSNEKIASLVDVKIELARRMLEKCNLCERRCGVDRRRGERGHCGVLEPRISSEFIHMGEEPDLVPSYTIFFSGCTFNCVFCQNWDISTRPSEGARTDPASIARKIEAMAKRGRTSLSPAARNVNWVGGDPTSNLPFILETLRECTANIPQVWNSNMYLTERAMNLLDGMVDVFLTDFKYGNDECALRLSNAKDYMRIVSRNHLLAREQAEMIIRHLVLPGHIECCTKPVLRWIAENLDEVKVNVMSQYRPEHRAFEFREISRSITMREYKEAINTAERLHLDLCD